MKSKRILTALTAMALTGCSSIPLPNVFNNGVKELPRFGTDAVHYQCANGQSFGLRLSDTKKDAWLMLPDHEINLNQNADDKSRYHYSTIDLHLNGDDTTLDDADHLHYKACKAVLSAPLAK